MDAVEATRLANLALGLLALVWLLARVWLRRRVYPPGVVLFLQVLAFFVLGRVYGTFEVLYFEDLNLRAYTGPVGIVALLVTLAVTRRPRPAETEEDRTWT
jgi:hypothetical protein